MNIIQKIKLWIEINAITAEIRQIPHKYTKNEIRSIIASHILPNWRI